MTLNKPYPNAPRSSTKEEFKSAKDGIVEIANPYDWLQDLESPETKAFVEAQNAAFQDFLPDTDPMVLGAKQKIGGILMKTYSDYFVTSAPKFVDEDVFIRVLGRGKPLGVTYRWRREDFLRESSLKGTEVISQPTVFHDEAETGNALISSSLSQGGKYWAYNEAVSGSDWGIIRVKSVDDASNVLADEIHDSKFNTKHGPAFAWLGDIGFFYQYWAAAPDTKEARSRPQLRFHRLRTEQSSDEVVYEDEDHPTRTFRVSLNDNGSVAVLEIFGATATSMVKVAKIQSSKCSPLKLEWLSVCDGLSSEWEYLGECSQDGQHLLWTNEENGKVVSFDLDQPSNIKQVVASVPGQPLRSAKLLPSGDILAVRSIDVEDELQVFSSKGERRGIIDTPAKTIVDMSFDTPSGTLFVMESSFCYAPRLWSRPTATESNISIKPLMLFAPPPVTASGSGISSKRHFYRSADGTRVPLFVTAEDSLEITAKTPVLLYIYGGFGISLIPHFRPEFVAFIRGFRGVLATANIRGGSEYGRDWYEAACKEKRQNLFDDIIGAARYVRSDITKFEDTPMILMGESMGALNSCSVMVQQPNLLSAVILNAGAFDILHRQHMGIKGRGAEDVGDSYNPAQFDFIRRWEPLQNLQVGTRYPPVLLTAGNQDDLVSMAHSLKMAAALQHAARGVSGAGIVSLRIIDNLGHGGNISALQRAAVTMSRWLWVMKALGLQLY